MSKKNRYKTRNVKNIKLEWLKKLVEEQTEIIVGIDVAKVKMVSTFMTREKEMLTHIRWDHPVQTLEMIDLLKALPQKIDIALEPSGTYGDSLRYQLEKHGFHVSKIGGKKSKDHTEIFDGVPSSHDAKSAAIIADLYCEKRGSAWVKRSDEEKKLRAQIRLLEMYKDIYFKQLNRLEAMIARHWPEIFEIMEIKSASILELLMEFGGPAAVDADQQKARELLRRVGTCLLKDEKIDLVVASAGTTLGVPMIEMEVEMVKIIATEARRAGKKFHQFERMIEKETKENEVVMVMGDKVGKVTAAVLYSFLGDPHNYSCPDAYVKAAGLNLKERSSGGHKGQIKITKRGPAIVRSYLYFAVLRLVKDDIYFHAWYHRKVGNRKENGIKGRAICALMRKLLKGLWHAGHKGYFVSEFLFNIPREKLVFKVDQ